MAVIVMVIVIVDMGEEVVTYLCNYSANRLFESPAARNLSNLNKSNKSIQKKI